MVWGWITMAGRTELHICQGCVTGLDYRDNGGGLFLACEDFGGRSVIPGLQGFFKFFSGDQLSLTDSTFFGQDQSTVAQRAKMTVAECSLIRVACELVPC